MYSMSVTELLFTYSRPIILSPTIKYRTGPPGYMGWRNGLLKRLQFRALNILKSSTTVLSSFHSFHLVLQYILDCSPSFTHSSVHPMRRSSTAHLLPFLLSCCYISSTVLHLPNPPFLPLYIPNCLPSSSHLILKGKVVKQGLYMIIFLRHIFN
jgi:hypothetical protein